MGTLVIDLLTRTEQRWDNLTGALRFDIALIADRLVKVIEVIARGAGRRGSRGRCPGGGLSRRAHRSCRPGVVPGQRADATSRGLGRPDDPALECADQSGVALHAKPGGRQRRDAPFQRAGHNGGLGQADQRLVRKVPAQGTFAQRAPARNKWQGFIFLERARTAQPTPSRSEHALRSANTARQGTFPTGSAR